MKKIAPARSNKQAQCTVTVESLRALAETAAMVSGLAEVVQEQVDEYKELLDDVVLKATGASIWGTEGLAAMGDNYDPLNRKSGAISYLLIAMAEKAETLEASARKLSNPVRKAVA